MRLSFFYWLLVIAWHVLILVLAYLLLHDHYRWFLLCQFGVAFSLYLAYRVYRHWRLPQELAAGGKSVLEDRDFSVKYRLTGMAETDSLVAVYNDMIDTLRQERTVLQEQQYFLRKLIEASPSGILILGYDGEITEANPAACDLLGFDPRQLATAQEVHPVLAAARTTPAGSSQQLTLNSTDHYRIEVGAFIDRGFSRKFVQIQALTQEILAAEKRAYGQVIRMMAHEVNNSIGAVNALLQTFSDPDAPTDAGWIADVRENLPVALERNHRLNVFMRNFAQVVRLPSPHLEQVELGPLLTRMSQLFQAQATQQGTTVVLHLPGEPVRVRIDPNQMEQVLVNVIRNALESLAQGGEIQITLQQKPFLLTIADNGPGLTEATAAAIFTPFFTSKPNGQGIGLTLVREILNNHGWRFSLATGADGWTRFVVGW